MSPSLTSPSATCLCVPKQKAMAAAAAKPARRSRSVTVSPSKTILTAALLRAHTEISAAETAARGISLTLPLQTGSDAKLTLNFRALPGLPVVYETERTVGKVTSALRDFQTGGITVTLLIVQTDQIPVSFSTFTSACLRTVPRTESPTAPLLSVALLSE